MREREFRQHKFAAALKGINLEDSTAEQAKESFENAQRRAQARLAGKSEDQVEVMEYAELGLDVDTD